VRTVALVLAAGAGSRFGGRKLLARVEGRPILAHVLDALATSPVDATVVVLGDDADAIETAIRWRGERRVRNPRPQDGLASSLRVGLDAVAEEPVRADAVLVVLGDQPDLRPDVVATVVAAAGDTDHPFVRPRYAGDAAPNPVLVRRAAWALAAGLEGDRGLGRLIAERQDLVQEVPVHGSNPDVDTPRDLVRLLEARWADRVRANRDQAERLREEQLPDFYAPVTGHFVADPRRTGEPTLDVLRTIARAGQSWLDIGAGAGRYALPLALAVREVIAVEPSPGMRQALTAGMRDHGIANIRVIDGGWPGSLDRLGEQPSVDVALIAHVGYDIEAIGPFVDAMEAAARDRCVAVLAERSPGTVADQFWPLVHGEARVPLPALPELLEILAARGHTTDVVHVERSPHAYASVQELAAFLRRQLFIAEGGAKDAALHAAMPDRIASSDHGWTLADRRAEAIGVVTWEPRPRR
jgi:molybdenum cofactor cytidylyltransferase